MLVVMKRDATKEEIDAVVERIKEFGITPVPLPGAERTAIGQTTILNCKATASPPLTRRRGLERTRVAVAR